MRLLFVCLLLAVVTACDERAATNPEPDQNPSIRFLAAGATQGFARATAPRKLVFPLDHGSHPE
ncbi:MAG TPA: carotenoid 1,2-hydratase, partial [Gammaproteobacteria bacterium]|nr:carotenoid 1,2-hydratase [Gammaproteobacteria bacterium]